MEARLDVSRLMRKEGRDIVYSFGLTFVKDLTVVILDGFASAILTSAVQDGMQHPN